MEVRFENIKQGTKTPIIMVHGDEANKLLPKLFKNDIPFYIFRHMGNKERAFPLNTIEEIAKHYSDYLLKNFDGNTFILSGYSIGGVIAYEMMQQLKDKKNIQLVLLDSVIPNIKTKVQYHNRQVKWNENLLKKIYKRYKKKIILAYYKITKSKMRKSHFFYHRMEKYRKARKNYLPKRFDKQLILIKSTIENFSEEALGWRKYADDVKVFHVESTHHEITSLPAVKDVAQIFESIHQNFEQKIQYELK